MDELSDEDKARATIEAAQRAKMQAAHTALGELCQSHKVRLVGIPQYVEDGQGGFKVRVDVALVPAQ